MAFHVHFDLYLSRGLYVETETKYLIQRKQNQKLVFHTTYCQYVSGCLRKPILNYCFDLPLKKIHFP